MTSARTLVVAGLFDFQKQVLLYVPQHLPDPRSDGFPAKAAAEIRRLLDHSRGRAFVLFMSYQQMQQIHDRCAQARVPFFFKQWGGVVKSRAGRVLDTRTWDEMPVEDRALPLAHRDSSLRTLKGATSLSSARSPLLSSAGSQ